jgi:ubiquinone/menaquinone biosynthesis C-methylase UbiE
MSLYDIGGRIYECFYLLWTFGKEEELKRRAVADLPICPGDSVLDWGCGTGLSTACVLAALQGEGEVFALDLRPAMIQRAAARFRASQRLVLHFIVRDGFGLQLQRPVDKAVAMYSLGVVPPEQSAAAVEEIWRNLKPDGKLVVIDMYVPEPRTPWSRFLQPLNCRLISRLFEQDFSGALMANLTRYFEPLAVEYHPRYMTFVFLGRRLVSPTSQGPHQPRIA